MIREIEFRAKANWKETDMATINRSYRDGDWVCGDLHLRDKRPHIHDANNERVPIDVDTIGQFTGMYDSNGNKIYEGDIVKVTEDQLLAASPTYVGFIDFRRGMWCVCTYHKSIDFWFDTPFYAHSKNGSIATVIGNMTDTPELVNQLNS